MHQRLHPPCVQALEPATRMRVLRRSYATLISMAPMVSLSEVLYTLTQSVSYLAAETYLITHSRLIC